MSRRYNKKTAKKSKKVVRGEFQLPNSSEYLRVSTGVNDDGEAFAQMKVNRWGVARLVSYLVDLTDSQRKEAIAIFAKADSLIDDISDQIEAGTLDDDKKTTTTTTTAATTTTTAAKEAAATLNDKWQGFAKTMGLRGGAMEVKSQVLARAVKAGHVDEGLVTVAKNGRYIVASQPVSDGFLGW